MKYVAILVEPFRGEKFLHRIDQPFPLCITYDEKKKKKKMGPRRGVKDRINSSGLVS